MYETWKALTQLFPYGNTRREVIETAYRKGVITFKESGDLFLWLRSEDFCLDDNPHHQGEGIYI